MHEEADLRKQGSMQKHAEEADLRKHAEEADLRKHAEEADLRKHACAGAASVGTWFRVYGGTWFGV
jgi:hypothetical protein